MVFGWFDATQAKQAGKSIAAFFMARVPLQSLDRTTMSIAKHEKVIDKVYRQVEQAIAEHKLNAYKKAKLADAFQKELLKAGYDGEFVGEITQGIVLKLGYR